MTAPDRYIPGVPCWADTNQPDPDAAARFYGELFGWQCENVMPPDADATYLIGRLSGGDVAAITGFPDDGTQQAAWNTYIWVENADATAVRVKKAGGSVVMGPWDVLDQGRMAVCSDREGAHFMIWEPRAHRGSAVVNEPGSVNFNDLYTRDLESAKQFYGAVFGWEVLDLGPGAYMWALPGYGDHLDVLNPGTTKAMAEMGAPTGFENVVASVNVLSSDEPDTQPYWGITFAVADADATAAKAVELGGRIVTEPVDAPWVRMSVLQDPAGAVFTASQFKPENT